MRAGDRLIGVNRMSVDELSDLNRSGGPTVHIEVERDGELHSIESEAMLGCGFPARLLQSDQVNAHADGEQVMVTTALMREIADDKLLAFIVGHELAHDLDWARTARRGSPRARHEANADHVGIYLAAMAGYRLSYDADLYLALQRDVSVLSRRSITHPLTTSRAAAFRKTLEEIRSRQEAGLPLLPER
jgi:hypothetical protein